ncbi:DUF1340 domain-containing protein [Streptococcus vestibularis]|jgi:orf235 gp|uniref:DUF1340 domain-containing protein n=1 Tax=Streptococcus vestibularis TaxID=1343 RepID=UPI001BED0486|nr:DUF1340 domain-containing protein [Streptococcus vestibularis]MBT3132085.1 DUF1340 domain-containing protein [Streptococcus vestibularis]MDU3178780.1 DUF1340 domain-containing protein [Streptococcus vestibularis]
MTKYQYAGLTKELHSRLVSEHAALKEAHPRDYKQFFQDVRQCGEKEAVLIYQAFNNIITERWRMSPQTAERLEGIISDELSRDLQDYLSKHYTRGKTTRPAVDRTNAGLPEELFKRFRKEVEALRVAHTNDMTKHIMAVKDCSKKDADTIRSIIGVIYLERVVLTPRKVIQLEGLLSRELLGDIARHVFNHYEWPESLDSEVDRITLEYRTKGEVGRNKSTVRKALYTAYALGV